MKKVALFALIISVGFISCKKKGCTDENAINYDSGAKKDNQSCNYLPTISLNGNESDTITLGEIYNDLGATATNYDGAAVLVVRDSSLFNKDSIGTYVLTYTASNEHGSVSTERNITVVEPPFSIDDWLGAWVCSNQCDATQFPLTADPDISIGSAQTIVIDNMFTGFGGAITCDIDGLTISVAQQIIDLAGFGEMILSGSGSMNNDKTQFTILYDYENTLPFIGGTGTCEAFYDK
jgi:hypothetical protein